MTNTEMYLGRPTVTEEEVARYTVADDNAYAVLKHQTIKCACRQVPFDRKGNMISRSTADYLIMRGVKKGNIAKTIPFKSTLPSEDTIPVPRDAEALIHFLHELQELGTDGTYPVISGTKENFIYLIACFGVYEEFRSLYNQYILDKDETVKLVSATDKVALPFGVARFENSNSVF